jgi:hypothetical protein
MSRRSYWLYSAACAGVWIIILVVAKVADPHRYHELSLVFLGFAIAWVSGTIARYVYPPPRRWRRPGV